MKIRDPRLIRLAAFVGAGLIRVWMATLRYRIVNHDAVEHPADADRHRFVYAFWHETLLAPVRLKARVRVLISKHADGELIAQAAGRLGFGVVRGSTARGGGGALVELWDCSRSAHLVFHPDGPRGPRRKVQPGVVALAARAGLPVVPVGVGYARCWRAGSWDRFAVPWPFTRCVLVAGEAVVVPADLGRDGLGHFRRMIEERLLEATAEAEALAAGTSTARRRNVAPRRARRPGVDIRPDSRHPPRSG